MVNYISPSGRKLKVARAFLRLPALDFWSVRYSRWILSIRWICLVMLCLFCSCTCGGPHMPVAFWAPLTIPSLSPFSVSPSGAEAFPPQELRYRDSKISSLAVLIPLYIFFMFLLCCLADFDRLLLCFGPVVVPHQNSFRSLFMRLV